MSYQQAYQRNLNRMDMESRRREQENRSAQMEANDDMDSRRREQEDRVAQMEQERKGGLVVLLTSMGFDSSRVRQAMVETNWNFDAALELLLAEQSREQVSEDPPPQGSAFLSPTYSRGTTPEFEAETEEPSPAAAEAPPETTFLSPTFSRWTDFGEDIEDEREPHEDTEDESSPPFAEDPPETALSPPAYARGTTTEFEALWDEQTLASLATRSETPGEMEPQSQAMEPSPDGFCRTCGTKVCDVRTGGLFHRGRKFLIPLTIPGVVMSGRCLYCHPDPTVMGSGRAGLDVESESGVGSDDAELGEGSRANYWVDSSMEPGVDSDMDFHADTESDTADREESPHAIPGTGSSLSDSDVRPAVAYGGMNDGMISGSGRDVAAAGIDLGLGPREIQSSDVVQDGDDGFHQGATSGVEPGSSIRRGTGVLPESTWQQRVDSARSRAAATPEGNSTAFCLSPGFLVFASVLSVAVVIAVIVLSILLSRQT